MTNQSAARLEIFLALAFSSGAKQSVAAENFMPSADFENESTDEGVCDNLDDERFAALFEYLTEPEAKKIRRIAADFQNKTEAEKTVWRERILREIGTDDELIDETVHSSHASNRLEKEIPAVQKIIRENVSTPIGKTVRRAFARQFVSLRDLPKPTRFDRLSGSQLARLIRLAGIREVALACARIEAVESVAAFLRRFPAEDARAVAAQLNNLRQTPEPRLAFAEHLVQTTIEIESQPAAMLDLLGIWLVGILLCESSDEMRLRYTNQKLPLEIYAKLPEIIDNQCRDTPQDLQKKVSAEIEQLAETIAKAADDIKSA